MFLTNQHDNSSVNETSKYGNRKLFDSYLWSYLNPNEKKYNFIRKFKVNKNKFDTGIINGEFNPPELSHSISPIIVQTKNNMISKPISLNAENLKSVDYNYKTSFQIYLDSDKSFPIYDFKARSYSRNQNI